MPYIRNEERSNLDTLVDTLFSTMIGMGVMYNPGILNYVISKLLVKMWQCDPSYAVANMMMGVLECVKHEFYRRAAAPYEDKKAQQNGDIY